MALLSLSDEVLVHICLFLSGIDRLSLSMTCLRFNQLMNEKKLVRKLSFSYARQLRTVSLKSFFRAKLRYENIVSIDLSSCYWLPSVDVYTCLKKMRNLMMLNVIDTHLSDVHLLHLLKDLPKLTHLSCSNIVPAGTPNIEYLQVEKACWMFSRLCNMIKCFPNLRELWVKCTRIICVPQCSIQEFGNFNLHYLHTLAVQLHDPVNDCSIYYSPIGATNFIDILLAACSANCRWKVYWLDSKLIVSEARVFPLHDTSSQLAAFLPPFGYEFGESPVGMTNLTHLGYLENLPFKRWLNETEGIKLNHLFLPHSVADVVTLPPTLKHLNISGCWSWINLRTSSTLENLHCLSMPFCLFNRPALIFDYSIETMLPLPGPSHANKRMSRISTDPWPYSRLTMFIKVSPNLRHLRIVGCSSEVPCHVDFHESVTLPEICSWRNLRTLSLECLHVPVRNILVKIAQACPLIESLHFSHLQGHAMPATYIANLKEAIQYWRKLKHLSLRERELILLPGFLDALQKHCPLMERLVLISHGETSPLSAATCLSLIENFPSMVMFYVSLSRITKDMAIKFKKEVDKRYKKSRPTLWAKMEKYSLENEALEDCPLIHLNDMITHVTPFSIFPDCNC